MADSLAAGTTLLLIVAVVGCSNISSTAEGSSRTRTETTPAAVAPRTSSHTPIMTPSRSASAPPPAVRLRRAQPQTGSAASVTIPSIGVRRLRFVAYTGHADDLPGTRIQDRGLAASPRGPRGGVGPGEVGNLIITAHRTSAGGPFRRLPSLRHGEHIVITTGGTTYDYVVTGTMTISFRSAADLARQSAPVPGHPGRRPTRPMVTLSTCATPEDHARGNYWADELGNPEHRIDKVGVLVAVRSA
jgi:sortase A